MNGTVLVRAPGRRLAEGIVTHISRSPVEWPWPGPQHAAYADALAACGWMIRQAPAAEDCPDSVFIEDAVVVCEDLAVLTHPGAPARRAEVAGVSAMVWSLGLRTARIHQPGTLDGGDVLQAGRTVYVGRGGRTNGAGIRQLRALLALLALLGRTVIAVPLSNVLHLKSAVTALPDGTFLLLPQLVPAGLFPAVRPVAEEVGCHVVPLGRDRVLIAAAAPRTTWLSTVNPDGSPHVTVVGALWLDGTFWFQTGAGTRKGRNVARDPRCSIAVSIRDADVVIEGDAARVTQPGALARSAQAWADNGWPAEPDDNGPGITAPFNAPSQGPPPWNVYRIEPRSAIVVLATEPGGLTRFRF